MHLPVDHSVGVCELAGGDLVAGGLGHGAHQAHGDVLACIGKEQVRSVQCCRDSHGTNLKF